MKIAIVGIGHVGLVSGACFASKGHSVSLVDVDPNRVRRVQEGRAPFFEPGLDELLARGGEHLQATSDLAGAVADAEVVMLAVGTPFDGRHIDLEQVRQASQQVGEALRQGRGYQLVMVKSTVLPGTTDELVGPVLEQASGRRAGEDFGLAMNPEFLREGQAVQDFLHPDRVVMGGTNTRCWELQEALYRDFPCSDLLRTDNRTAEMIKYTANSLLATLISFSNEIGNLCATLPGVDVRKVMEGVHLDKRISPLVGDTPPAAGERITPGVASYLMAGCGFGGSCLPKDLSSLVAFAKDRSSPTPMLEAALDVNRAQPLRLVQLVEQGLPTVQDAVIAVLGLAFKPGTSDLRETPAMPVIRALLERGAVLRLHDPAALEQAARTLGEDRIYLASDLEDAVEGVEAVVLVTSWPQYARLPELLEGRQDPPLVVDGRRMLDQAEVRRYAGIGLGPELG